LFTEFINKLLTLFENRKRSLTIYAHNLSKFDGVLLMKHLIHFGKVKPIVFNGKLISIKITLSMKGHIGKTLIFKDSMLLIPLSLRQLCESFKVVNKKGYISLFIKRFNLYRSIT
jgi:hypothetical protein